jgi:prolyl-tRNA editing enzyme YbaK/EbsC (Cys-tRNA(Pro) deacylase)
MTDRFYTNYDDVDLIFLGRRISGVDWRTGMRIMGAYFPGFSNGAQTVQPLSPADVQAALDGFGFGIQMIFFDDSTATSQMAADNIGCELAQIVKSLAFIVDGQPVLVLASGDQRVDDRKIAARYNVGRKRVRVATPEECITIYGYAPGGVPPIGLRTPGIPTYLDDMLQRHEQLYAAGGAHNAIFPVTRAQLAQISGGTWMDVARKDSPAGEGG